MPHPHEEIRCFCADNTLLAVIKRDKRGKPVVHMKIYKARRIFGEIILSLGEMEMRCRDCLRWHKVRILRDDVDRAVSRRPRTTHLDLQEYRSSDPDGLRDDAARA